MKVFHNDNSYEREKKNYSKFNGYPFLCKLQGTTIYETEKCLILEYIDGYLLSDVKETLSLNEKIKIIFEMMISFNYLHKFFVIRDIHPNNFLLNKNKTLILIDFDRMHFIGENMNDSISHQYLAPESCNEFIFTFQSDIYSLGKIIHFLFGKELKTDKLKILNIMFEQCTDEDPKKRPSLSQLISDFYINYFSKISNQVDEIETFKSIDDITDIKYNNYLIFLAESNNQFSLNELAKIYDKNGIFNDINKAIRYYSLAVEQNNQEAKNNLQNIYKNLIDNTKDCFGNIYNGIEKNQFEYNCLVKNQNLQKLYKQFNFLFLSSKMDLIDFLKDAKFIVYDYYITNSTAVICFEKNCLIINSTERMISELLTKVNASIINVSNCNTKLEKTLNDLLAIEEVNNYCKYFHNEIEANEFAILTIRAIATFIIRRNFYCSSYFKDSSFFEFDNGIQSYEHGIKRKLYEIFDYKEDLRFNIGLKQFIFPIFQNKFHDLKIDMKNILKDFKKSDFIMLRCLHSDDNSSYVLAIHIKSLFIFMIKMIKDENEHKKEINFHQNYFHLCLNQLYGFLKEDDKITGFVYQYITNVSLKNYVSNHSNDENPIFKLITIIRIIEIIYYFEAKSIKNININISNIFLDQNNIPFLYPNQFISDDENCNLLESLGSIIYYLYEKTELSDTNAENLNCPPNIKKLFQLCFKKDKYENLRKSFIETLFDEIKYSNFFPEYIMGSIKMKTDDLINISYEMINYVSCLTQVNQLSITILSFFYNIFALYLQEKGDIAEIYYQRGNVYQNGSGVDVDYQEAKRCYELSKTPKSILHLGFIYGNSFGIEKNYQKALECFQESSKYEKKYSYYELGCIYEKGLGVEIDHSKAKEYFLISCQADHETCFHLGFMYENGIDFIQDYVKAKEYYELGAQYEDSNSLTHLGLMYLKGLGVQKNLSNAKNYFERSAKKNNPDAFYYLGRLSEKGKGSIQNIDDAIYYYEKSAKLKNSFALLRLVKLLYEKNPSKSKEYYREYAIYKSNILLNIGIHYNSGYGIKKDYKKAKEMYELAVLLKNPEPYLYLGSLYENGDGVPINHDIAKKYFEIYHQSNQKAIFHSEIIFNKPANVNQYYKNSHDYVFEFLHTKSNDIYQLGRFFEIGCYLDRNINLAIRFYQLSSQYNNSKALAKLGNIFENSFDIKKDLLRAEYYYIKASEYGNAVASYHLDLIYLYNYNNPMKAIYYFKLSGNSDSLLQLGKMHQKGLGIEKNYKNAKKCYKLSSKYNNSEAFLLLGDLYFKGKGVKQDYIKAIQYYKNSSELSNSKAMLKLGIIYYNGIGVDFNISLSINYYLNCINNEKKNRYFPPIYYIACNDIGLIYLIEYQDEQKAQKYIIESGTNEYPIGQNSYAVLLLYYLNNRGRAKDILEKCSSDNHLILTNFILAHLYEEENKIKNSIKFLKKVCENSNKQIMFRGEKIYDEMFQLSQKFVVCFACIMLVQYYLLNNKFKKAKKYFICALSNKENLLLMKDFENIFSSLRKFLAELIENNSKSRSKIVLDLCIKEIKQDNNDYLFNLIVKNECNYIYFMEEIRKIIENVKNILFKPPYSIILGRIKYHKQYISNDSQESVRHKNITKTFYDGFNQ